MTDTRERGGPGAVWRDGVRRRPGGALLLRAVALVVGVAFIALGAVLVVLPGPLTIPPVLVGVWVLSLEFTWAEALLARVRSSAQDAWEGARRRPVVSGAVTAGGLVLAAVVVWAAVHADVVTRGKDAVGL